MEKVAQSNDGRLRYFFCLLALVFIVPSLGTVQDSPEMVLSGEPPAVDAGIAESAGAEPVSSPAALPEDGQLLALKEAYAAKMQSLSDQLQSQSDPSESERIQKECESTKAEEEKAMAQLQLEIAVENGNADRVRQLEEVREALEQTPSATPGVGEPVQPPPAPDDAMHQMSSKNPDDQ